MELDGIVRAVDEARSALASPWISHSWTASSMSP